MKITMLLPYGQHSNFFEFISNNFFLGTIKFELLKAYFVDDLMKPH